jgi:hypothetical protein
MSVNVTTIATPPAAPLRDELGPIPEFPPLALDAQGRILPLTDEEWAARSAAAARALRALDRLPDDDPPGVFEGGMRDIDAHRPHRPLFEGMG